VNIGIIVYSKTGNTFEVASRLKGVLEQKGHSINLERVTIEGKAKPGDKEVRLINIPAVESYEEVIFGSPVQAFSLAVAMETYLKQIPTLEGKEVSLFVTKHLPFAWTGGNRTLGQMEKICKDKGAGVREKEIIFWNEKSREETIKKCIANLSSHF